MEDNTLENNELDAINSNDEVENLNETKAESVMSEDEEIEEEFDWGDDLSFEDENADSDNPGGDAGPPESKLKRCLDIFGSLFALNLCFVFSILPVFTIGAACTAMYAMMYKIQRHDDYTVVKEYFQEFKKNFKKGTIAWLIMVLAFVILWGQYMYICNFQDAMAMIYSILLLVEGVLACLIVPFVFPLLAYFDNTIKNTFKNALLLAVSNLGAWLKIFIAWTATFFFCFGYEVVILNIWYLWFFIIFGLLFYGSSVVAKKVFDKIRKKQKEMQDDPNAITMKEAKERKKQEKAQKKKKFASEKSIKDHVAIMDVVNGVATKNDKKEEMK
ncbi:MAG: YesL family protein [Lachnospiraceae bacterium]